MIQTTSKRKRWSCNSYQERNPCLRNYKQIRIHEIQTVVHASLNQYCNASRGHFSTTSAIRPTSLPDIRKCRRILVGHPFGCSDVSLLSNPAWARLISQIRSLLFSWLSILSTLKAWANLKGIKLMEKGGFCQGLRLLRCSSLTDAYLDARWGREINASAM